MKITEIAQQKNNKKRVSVFIDGEFSFGADSFAVLSHHLKAGDEITEKKLAEFKNTALFEDAKNYAARLISARSYTEKGIREKLDLHIGDAEITEKTIEFLKEYKLIDDQDFATRYTHDLVNLKKCGLSLIKRKLKEKGIADDIIASVLSELDFSDTFLDNLHALAEKKLNHNYDIKNIMKVNRSLLTKGYSYDDINSVFSKIKAKDEDYDG